MNFSPDLSKQVREVIFSQTMKKISYPPLFFKNIQVSKIFISETPRYFTWRETNTLRPSENAVINGQQNHRTYENYKAFYHDVKLS